MDQDICGQDKNMKIGIMGGTFNPIHNGHLIVTEDVRVKCGLDRVLFITSGQPPHKLKSEVIDAIHRYEMVRRAVSSNPFFEASRIEIDRGGYSYTVNTLRQLKKEYGDGVDFYFIIGADIIPELITWREYEKVFQLCDFIAILRPGHDWPALSAQIKSNEENYGVRIHPVDSHLVDISSTEIRERCKRGESIKYLVPDEVEDYIKTKGLYKGSL